MCSSTSSRFRHPELVSGSIVQRGTKARFTIGSLGLRGHGTAREAGWTLKQVQGDELMTKGLSE